MSERQTTKRVDERNTGRNARSFPLPTQEGRRIGKQKNGFQRNGGKKQRKECLVRTPRARGTEGRSKDLLRVTNRAQIIPFLGLTHREKQIPLEQRNADRAEEREEHHWIFSSAQQSTHHPLRIIRIQAFIRPFLLNTSSQERRKPNQSFEGEDWAVEKEPVRVELGRMRPPSSRSSIHTRLDV